MPPGSIVILNGAPRSGKSSIVRVIQAVWDGPWMSLGVDVHALHVTPERYRPGIGLRPGGERPEIEALVPALYAALYESIAAHSRQGLNVVVDVGHHDAYAQPRHILPSCARRLAGLPALVVGIRCPIETIMQRRQAGEPGRDVRYLTTTASGEVPAPVARWQHEVHVPGIYDLEIDSSTMSPEAAALIIRRRLEQGPQSFTAASRLAASAGLDRDVPSS